jgi:hypothetical protein
MLLLQCGAEAAGWRYVIFCVWQGEWTVGDGVPGKGPGPMINPPRMRGKGWKSPRQKRKTKDKWINIENATRQAEDKQFDPLPVVCDWFRHCRRRPPAVTSPPHTHTDTLRWGQPTLCTRTIRTYIQFWEDENLPAPSPFFDISRFTSFFGRPLFLSSRFGRSFLTPGNAQFPPSCYCSSIYVCLMRRIEGEFNISRK